MRYAVVRSVDGLVTNVVEWSGDPEVWGPPKDHAAIRSDAANVGGRYDGVAFVPPEPLPADGMAIARGRLAALRAKGWRDLTADERDEAQRLIFELL